VKTVVQAAQVGVPFKELALALSIKSAQIGFVIHVLKISAFAKHASNFQL
jgi:hypothetical protein